ncbi:Lrp/AsnC family transcriptional regulator [Streptomyces inhibens]|uniref:Lrp/AsnC family transcriptional regulator n=1 Tax=Streptomyces inhibens TaxID=2293571 RepID=UPI0037BC7360
MDGPIAGLAGVVGIETQLLLTLLLTANDWAPYDDEPTAVRRAVSQGTPLPAPLPTDELDERLVALLKEDARMSTTRLARELRVGETTARRRLSRLMGSHVLHLRLHAEPEVLGFPIEARFRLAVPQRGLDATLRALGREPEVRSLVLTSGRYNVLGYSSHRSMEELHDFSSRAFGAADGIATETALLIRSYKRAGATTL